MHVLYHLNVVVFLLLMMSLYHFYWIAFQFYYRSCMSEILYRASTYPLLKTVKKLLSISGININYRHVGDMSKTPIMALACCVGINCYCCDCKLDEPIAEALSLLIDHGADITICDQNEVSAR